MVLCASPRESGGARSKDRAESRKSRAKKRGVVLSTVCIGGGQKSCACLAKAALLVVLQPEAGETNRSGCFGYETTNI